jgi:N-acetylglucosamine kinase-like BadF-type ATPase
LYNQVDRQQIAACAKLVSLAAERGDKAALEILETAAKDLARYVTGVYRNLFHNNEVVPIVHIGGVFQSELLLEYLKQHIYTAISCPLALPCFSPVAGALLEALRLDGNLNPLSGLLQAD